MSKSEHKIKYPLSGLEYFINLRQREETFAWERKLKFFGAFLVLLLCSALLICVLHEKKIIDFSLNKTKETKIEYQWIPGTIFNFVYSNIVNAGYDKDGSKISLIRARDTNGKFVIGKHAERGEAYIYNNRREMRVKNFEFLTTANYTWQHDAPKSDRVYADKEKVRYVCRVKYFIDYYVFIGIPGFVDKSEKCKYTYDGSAYESFNFDVLSVP